MTWSEANTSDDSSFTIAIFLSSSSSGEGVVPPVTLVISVLLSPGGGSWPALTSNELSMGTWEYQTWKYGSMEY